MLIGQWLDAKNIELNVSEETFALAESYENAVNVVNNAKSVLDKFKATEKNLRDSIAKAQGTLSKRQTL